VLLDILEEHLEETEILWSRRRSALGSPVLDLAGLEALEARLRAHLDGVALGVSEAPGGLEARLRGGDADEAFAAAAALLLTRGRDSRAHVLDALREATPHGRAGIVEALCHLPLAEEVERALRVIVAAAGDARLGPALEVLSFHRRIPVAAIEPAVSADDAGTRRAAARAIGRVGGPAAWNAALAEDAEAGVRDEALAAAARRGQPWALERLRNMCRDSRRVTPEAIRLLSCLGDRGDVETLLGLARRAELGEAALEGLATLGLVECIGPVLELVTDGRLARAAGEAFRRITGLEVPARRDEPQSTEREDRTFEDLRPLPDVDAMRASWRARASDFAPGRRWRHGQALSLERTTTAPHEGDLRTRREELTRLWARAPGLFPNLELDAPAARQRMAA
jgi:uncharacterized protein (TIGR02270 family)